MSKVALFIAIAGLYLTTLAACANELLKTKDVKVSVLVLGFAEQ